MALRSRHRQAARESHARRNRVRLACSSARKSPRDRCRSTQSVGLISVENAAGQIGLLGVATGNEVQLDTVTAETLAPINLEDFPGNIAPVLAAQIPGLTVRRAFRYADVKATAAVKASAVEPDVRVESQDTLSLGEDRALLAVNATVEITRAGIFRLSFALPAGMDVESIAGKALSHWTELKTDAGRIITMHLRGRTEGQQQFAISLTGPGLKAAKAWAAPQLIFREASKQRGTFLVVPEQGMRLQVTTRDGVTQLDPQKSGIKQKGVLAFRVLQTPWNLALDIEQVDPWVQVTSLQHATVGEAQVKIAANLQYQIENTGLKAFRVALPVDAENVRFQGDQVADFLPVPNSEKEGLQTWEVKLHRRVIGQYLLQATYQIAGARERCGDQPSRRAGRGRELAARLRHRAIRRPSASARGRRRPPRSSRPNGRASRAHCKRISSASSASFAYRLVEPAFALPMKLERHEATKLLPARVNNITFTSVISDNGTMLTQVRLEMLPGDKRLLHLTLPKDAKFWFAFVNKNGVWPWREGDQILIPLEQQSRGDARRSRWSSFSAASSARRRDAISTCNCSRRSLTCRSRTSPGRSISTRSGRSKSGPARCKCRSEQVVSRAAAVDVQTYLQSEASQQREKTKAAEQMLAFGNNALAQGNPQQARRAFESAFGPEPARQRLQRRRPRATPQPQAPASARRPERAPIHRGAASPTRRRQTPRRSRRQGRELHAAGRQTNHRPQPRRRKRRSHEAAPNASSSSRTPP